MNELVLLPVIACVASIVVSGLGVALLVAASRRNAQPLEWGSRRLDDDTTNDIGGQHE